MSSAFFHNQKFLRFHGKPVEELETFVEKFYPFSELHFSGRGEIVFYTGLWLDGKPIMIETGMFEDDSTNPSSLKAEFPPEEDEFESSPS